MLTLTRLVLRNFGPFGAVDQAFHPTGAIKVSGRNDFDPGQDDNGSGKSTMIGEGLAFIVYDANLRGTRANDLIRDDQDEAYGRAEFVDDQNPLPLVFERTKKRGESSVLVTSRPVDLLSFSLFSICNVFDDTAVSFVTAQPAERQKHLEKIIGAERVEKALNAAKGEIERAEKVIADLERDSEKNQTKIDTLILVGEGLAEKFDPQSVAAAQATAQAELDSFQATYRVAVDAVAALESEQAESLALLQGADAQIADTEARFTKEIQDTASPAMLADVDRRIKDLPKKYADRIRKATSDKEALIQEQGGIQGQITAVGARITRYEALGPTCPTCEQAVDALHREKHLTLLQQEKGAFEKKLESVVGFVRVASADVEALAAQQVQDGQTLAAERTAIETKRDAILQRKASALRILAETRKRLSNERATRESSIRTETSSKIALEREIQRGTTTLAELKKSVADYEQSLKENLEQVEALDAERVRLRESLLAKREAIKPYLFWKKHFGAGGFRAWRLGKVLDVLNETLSELTETFPSFRVSFLLERKGSNLGKIEIKCLRTANNREYLYEQLSSGERRRVVLIVLFGLWRLGQSFPNGFRFLVSDEVFDKIDGDGRDSVADAVESMRAVGQVFVVTHVPDDSIQYDQHIECVKDPTGVSTSHDIPLAS